MRSGVPNRDSDAKPSSAWSRWRGEAAGGLTSALFVMPAVLGCGIIVYQPMGPSFQSLGIGAAFGAAIVAAAFRGLTGGAGLQVNAPRATQAALLGGLLVQAMHIATANGTADGVAIPVAALLALPVLALAVAGLFQLVLGALRLGDLLKFIPQPVVAGFVNGFALVILMQQLPNLLGLPDGTGLWAAATGGVPINPWALGLGAATMAGVWALGNRIPGLPAPLVGLALGTAVYQGLLPMVGPDTLGAAVKAPLAGLPFAPPLAGLRDLWEHAAFFSAMAPSILVTGLTLGVVTSIQSLLSAAAADALLGGRPGSGRELVTQGGANLLSAVVGGTVTGGSPLYTRVAIHNGARSDRANLFVGLVLLGAALGLGPVLERVPLSVMAGVVALTVLRPDDWTMQVIALLRRRHLARAARRELLQTLGIVLTVAVLVATVDVLTALAVGMGLSVVVYLQRAATSVVRRSYHGDRVHSQTGRSAADLDLLDRYGKAIAVMELHGPVFFGSAENLARTAEQVMAGSDTLILDMARVNDLESTGVLVLRRLDQRLKRDGKRLLMAGLRTGHGLRALMRDMGFDALEAEGRIHDTLETALADAEDRLLACLSIGREAEAELPLRNHPSLLGLTDAQFDLLSLFTRRLTFAPGERIVSEGSTDNSQYYLVKGRVRVEKHAAWDGHGVRLGSLSAGAVFGEMALLTGEPRSADILAESAVVCHELTAGDIAMLDSLDSSISYLLVRNIAMDVTAKIARMSRALTLSEA